MKIKEIEKLKKFYRIRNTKTGKESSRCYTTIGTARGAITELLRNQETEKEACASIKSNPWTEKSYLSKEGYQSMIEEYERAVSSHCDITQLEVVEYEVTVTKGKTTNAAVFYPGKATPLQKMTARLSEEDNDAR